MSQPASMTAAARRSGCVEPQSRLMFVAVRRGRRTVTSAPSRANRSGAIADAEPLAQSIADAQPCKRIAGGIGQVVAIARDRWRRRADAAQLGVRPAGQGLGLEDEPLELLLHLVVDLAAAGEHLEPVVGGRVVRGRRP